MPTIHPYEPQLSPNSPLPGRSPERLFASGEDFSGPGLQNLGHGMAAAGDILYDTAQRQEVSDVAARLAQARQQWTVEMQRRAVEAPAGDPNFASKFTEDFTDYMSKLGDGLSTHGGRMAFQRQSAELAAHLIPQAGAQQVHLAGVKAVGDFRTAQDANTATLQRDPTQFISILNDTVANLNDRNGVYAKMPAADREKLLVTAQEGLASAAARGMISANPDAALQMLQDGTAPWSQYLKGIQPSVLKGEAQSAINAVAVKQHMLDLAAEKAERIAGEKAANSVVSAIIKAQAPGSTSALPDPVKDVAENPNIKANEKWSLYAMINGAMQQDQSKDAKTYGSGFYQVYQDIHSGKITDPAQLYSRVGPGPDGKGPNDLTVSGVDKATQEIMAKRTPEGEANAALQKQLFKVANDALSGTNDLLKLKDPEGDQIMLRWMAQAYQDIAAGKAAGKTIGQMTNPDSPDYIGKSIEGMKRSPAQKMRDLIKGSGVRNVVEAGLDPKVAEEVAPPNATRTVYDRTGRSVYEVGGKWIYGDGKEYKP